MALTNMFPNFLTRVILCTVSFEAFPLGAIKHNGAESCVSNTGIHVLLPEPWALKVLSILLNIN